MVSQIRNSNLLHPLAKPQKKRINLKFSCHMVSQIRNSNSSHPLAKPQEQTNFCVTRSNSNSSHPLAKPQEPTKKKKEEFFK